MRAAEASAKARLGVCEGGEGEVLAVGLVVGVRAAAAKVLAGPCGGVREGEMKRGIGEGEVKRRR